MPFLRPVGLASLASSDPGTAALNLLVFCRAGRLAPAELHHIAYTMRPAKSRPFSQLGSRTLRRREDFPVPLRIVNVEQNAGIRNFNKLSPGAVLMHDAIGSFAAAQLQ